MTAKTICPVMNSTVDMKTARSKQMVREFKARKYYLCCKTCVVLFDKSPAAYTEKKES